MSVDFTKENKISNIDYLKEYLKDNDEALEFLDAIKTEMDDLAAEKIAANNEADELESKIEELKVELEQRRDYEQEIDTLNGPSEMLAWSCRNYNVIDVMEALEECIHNNVPIKKIANVLRTL